MARKFTIQKDYYDEGVEIYKKTTFSINPGITVLVGCNGAGKTTLLHHIRERLQKSNIPCIMYNNLTDGGQNSVSEHLWHGNMGFAATALCSSEGERIHMNIGNLASRLGKFMRTGIDAKTNPFATLKIGQDTEETPIPNERWVLLDAIDSGLSVDNIIDIKCNLFDVMMKSAQKQRIELYVLVVANEYEMARGEQCLDVQNGTYRTFENYEDYREFVLNSRELKNTRYEKETKAKI